MNRKKNITKTILSFLVVMLVMGFVSSEAINLTLWINISTLWEERKKNVRPIHFKEFENDFGGLFFFTNINSDNNDEEWGDDEPQEWEYENVIQGEDNSETHCKDQIKWFYYNAERWERLRPLDSETLDMYSEQWLTMKWWIYTNCSPSANNSEYETAQKCCINGMDGDECDGFRDKFSENSEECSKQVAEEYVDPYSYYGWVFHEYSGQKFILAVWIQYLTWTPWIQTQSKIWRTFQRHPQEWSYLPFGLIYDNLWWVGFAWCEVKSDNSLDMLIEDLNKEGTDGKMKEIRNLFDVKRESEEDEPVLKYHRDTDPTMEYFNCEDVWKDNGSALKILIEWLIWMRNDEISYYKDMDARLRKTQYFASTNINNATLINHARQKAELLCRWKWDTSSNPSISGNINCIDRSNKEDALKLKESNRNKTIIVKNWDVEIKPFSGNDNTYYDMFIDSGNLIIDETAEDNKFVIKTNGFATDDITSEAFQTACNTIMQQVNDWEIATTEMWDSFPYIGVASILKWNFIVNWNVKSKSGTGLSNKYFIYWKLTSLDSSQSLNDTFVWWCNSWLGTDDIYCPGPKVNWTINQYQKAPLVIIDQNYDSPLLKY